MAIAMFVDDVLRKGIGGGPIYQGLALFRMFNQDIRVILLCEEKNRTNRWLLEHNISKIDDLVDYTVPGIHANPDLDLVKYVRSQGKLDLVVTGNVELSKELLEQGIDTLLFLHPTYLRPEFRPDSRQGVKSWAAIEQELEKQANMIREDPRV